MAGETGRKAEGTGERLWRLARDVNALGAIALFAAGAVFSSAILTGWGAFNAAQAGAYEIGRQHAKKSRRKRTTR